MEHWFDRATKSLAATLSRRDLLEGAALTSISTFVPRLPRLANSTGVAAAPCAVQTSPAKTTLKFTANGSYEGRPLTVTGIGESLGFKYPTFTLTLRADLDGRRIMTVRVDFGHTFGPKHTRVADMRTSVVFEPSPGVYRKMETLLRRGVIKGSVDGHPFVTSIADARTTLAPIIARYKPPLAPALGRTITDLMKSAAATCKAQRTTASTQTRAAMLSFTGMASFASDGAAPEEIADSLGCDFCRTGCYLAAAACLAAIAWVTGPAAVIAEANCALLIWTPCMKLCDIPGGACCNLYCHSKDIGQFCCPDTATCCVDTCCGGSLPVCAPIYYEETGTVGFCCPENYFGCYSWGDHCCPNGTTCCNFYCCDNNTQVCANQEYGFCCPKGQNFCNFTCCSGLCITAPNGTQTCCAPGYTNCGGTCCRPDFVCLSGSSGPPACCPKTDFYCGGTCCPSYRKCYTTSTGKQVCCDKPLCGDECCAGTICVNGKCVYGRPCGNTYCGLGGVCCSGVCCAPNQTCAAHPKAGQSPCVTPSCSTAQVLCPDSPLCCPPGHQCCIKQCCAPGTECCGVRGCVPTGTCIQ